MAVERNGNIKYKGIANSCFLLIEPKAYCNSDDVAARLARCKGVKEVHLTTGKYGFVVSAKVKSDGDIKDISSAVRKTTKTNAVNVVTSQFVYK